MIPSYVVEYWAFLGLEVASCIIHVPVLSEGYKSLDDSCPPGFALRRPFSVLLGCGSCKNRKHAKLDRVHGTKAHKYDVDTMRIHGSGGRNDDILYEMIEAF